MVYYYKMEYLSFLILILVRMLQISLEYSYCNMERSGRIDCAKDYNGEITQSVCENESGCCYGKLESNSNEPR